jgi:hemolysin activation/secretion protein
MNLQGIKALIWVVVSDLVVAGACSGGFCGATLPVIPTDLQKNTQLKTFKAAGKNTENKGYHIWGLVDNAGDDATGEYRLMSGADINTLFSDNDTLSLFGVVSSESLKSGKVTYAYTLPWKGIVVEASYINTHYTLVAPFPGSKGVGTVNAAEGKILYPLTHLENKTSDFFLSVRNNNIDEEITTDFFVTNDKKKSYSATLGFDYEIKKYQMADLNTDHKLFVGITTGHLSFDDPFKENLDRKGANTQGSYTKLNINYSNALNFTKNVSLESNFRSQYAFNNKNLDDSESFIIGGINGVKIYEEGAAYDSNGIFANIESKYKLPALGALKNTMGIFYDYGWIWASDSINDDIRVQDAGIGIYTSYKKFFSRIQAAFKTKDSVIVTKDDKNYRILFQSGFSF